MTTAATIKVMCDLARADARAPTVRAFADQVAERALALAARSGSDVGAHQIAEAVEALVRERIAYVPDPEEYELVRAPDYLLAVDPRGDCDDQATLVAAALLALDYRPQLARIGYGVEAPDDPYSHVVVLLAPSPGAPASIVIDSTTRPDAQGSMLASARTWAVQEV